MLVYAAPEDLTTGDWLDVVPDDAERLLRAASGLVRAATRAAVYRTDSAGLPLDDDVAHAFRDATCAQVATWVALKVDPTAGGADRPRVAQSKSLGSGSVTYADAADVAAARRGATSILTEQAAQILADAPVWWGPVVYG